MAKKQTSVRKREREIIKREKMLEKKRKTEEKRLPRLDAQMGPSPAPLDTPGPGPMGTDVP